jgi:hypothetical protein
MKTKTKHEAVGRAQRLCQHCQLPGKNSLDIRGILAILSRHLFIRRFLAKSLAVCCGTLRSAVRCVINITLDGTDDAYFRFLLCKPSSLISCHLVPKLRTSGPSPETSLQGTALHFSTNSSSNSYRIVRLGTTKFVTT